MALRYEVAEQAMKRLQSLPSLEASIRQNGKGVLLLKADAQGIHRLSDVLTIEQSNQLVLNTPGQAKLVFRLRGGGIHIATDAWFFPEGQGGHYAQARYGSFKVNAQGNGVLLDLLDEHAQGLKARANEAYQAG